jgi:hypothetical protein
VGDAELVEERLKDGELGLQGGKMGRAEGAAVGGILSGGNGVAGEAAKAGCAARGGHRDRGK